jgi:hypothetical protein
MISAQKSMLSRHGPIMSASFMQMISAETGLANRVMVPFPWRMSAKFTLLAPPVLAQFRTENRYTLFLKLL